MKKKRKKKENGKDSIMQSLERQVTLMEEKKRSFTAANYKKAKQSICRFLGEEANTGTLNDLTSEDVSEYITHLECSGLCINSVSFYGSTFRAMYNHSVEHLPEREKEKNPFSGLRLKHTETIKRTLSESEMDALIDCDLSAKPEMAKSRDLFMFLFFTCGMCFVDAYHLQKNTISGGYINYVRSKTNMPLRVKINDEIQELLDRYDKADSPYLFPFLHEQMSNPEKTINEPSSLRRINRHLKKLGNLLEFSLPLTTYCARHSWASFAEASGISLSIISQALGHTSERITRTYLKGLPSHVVDEANKYMLDLMIRKKKKKEPKKRVQEEAKEKICPVLCKNKTIATPNSH